MLETLDVVLERLADPGPLINPESEDADPPAPFSDPPMPFFMVPPPPRTPLLPAPPPPPLPPPPSPSRDVASLRSFPSARLAFPALALIA